ncbi:hypothetical protein QRX50_18615 [Amycolatopsis carbonis]|uniref:Uncharacterized protein n=1 Tax=Amycolatopsis carbonis TaxID=715471 RepID=A0A9Y2IP95_9PSEU|nr:hypothetical protein [Amycolatopsis sp. 2-15]WIX82641.1 hypothetical protein QRX50_18615 [Amycolatopsis sp. 2-15]
MWGRKEKDLPADTAAEAVEFARPLVHGGFSTPDDVAVRTARLQPRTPPRHSPTSATERSRNS